MRTTATFGLSLGLLLVLVLHASPLRAAPVEVVYTGDEGCECPTQLGYQLNVPSPPKPKKYGNNDYGYRVEKPVQTKAKISYSFDFTVEQPRTPPPPKTNPAKLYAKVDRVTVNKGGKSGPLRSIQVPFVTTFPAPPQIARPSTSRRAAARAAPARSPGT